ncbi:MAG: N-formylglutamate amidohydrolase [Proteobacteria bacterium]|nr:N-formylglutamate amidohydrolase [Pseudomonadota bacterium]MBS0572022.1 N-formylglutamate amidohydrolase [Pseudomonadota bacterium]
MTEVAYRLTMPVRRTTSVVFASPHSGRDYPRAFLAASVLDERLIRTSEDAHVDDLLSVVPDLGAPLLAATVPRAFLDLNRAAEELDPSVVEGARSFAHNPRVQSGLGVIPRVVAGGRMIYSGKISLAEARSRIRTYWHPYHDSLARLLDESRALFGQAILMDMHSMPHEAMDQIAHRDGRRPDIVLGDRYGAAASGAVVDAVEQAFRSEGLRVARNTPFAGAYVAQTYGRPGIGQHVVQIEIDRALYLDEAAIRPGPGFDAFRRTFGRVLGAIAAIGRPEGLPLAAE